MPPWLACIVWVVATFGFQNTKRLKIDGAISIADFVTKCHAIYADEEKDHRGRAATPLRASDRIDNFGASTCSVCSLVLLLVLSPIGRCSYLGTHTFRKDARG